MRPRPNQLAAAKKSKMESEFLPAPTSASLETKDDFSFTSICVACVCARACVHLQVHVCKLLSVGSYYVIADAVQRIECNEGSCLQAASLVQPGPGFCLLRVCVHACVRDSGQVERCNLGNKSRMGSCAYEGRPASAFGGSSRGWNARRACGVRQVVFSARLE